MGAAPQKPRTWLGVAGISGMLVLLVAALQITQGPGSAILLVLSGTSLLVGLYFLIDARMLKVPAAVRSCRSCGEPVGPGARSCPHCGSPV